VEMLKSAVLKDPLKSLIHRKWLSLLTTKIIDFQRFLLLLGGKTGLKYSQNKKSTTLNFFPK